MTDARARDEGSERCGKLLRALEGVLKAGATGMLQGDVVRVVAVLSAWVLADTGAPPERFYADVRDELESEVKRRQTLVKKIVGGEG